MKSNASKNYLILVIFLNIAPFIIFLGNNSSQTEFLSINFFYIFLFCFIVSAIFGATIKFFKKSEIFILAISYLIFWQYYFLSLEFFFLDLLNKNASYFAILIIIVISFILTYLSRYTYFKKFILIILFLNISISIFKIALPLSENLLAKLKNIKGNKESYVSNKIALNYKPNIFYIIPDGMASPKVLKEYLNNDFNNEIKKLKSMGFEVPHHKYSSYNTTHHSLAALFNMSYHINENSPKYKNRKEFYPSTREKSNKLLNHLNKNNYEFIIVPPSWGGCPKSKSYKCLTPLQNNFFIKLFQDYTVNTMFKNSLIKKIIDGYEKFLITRNQGYVKSDMNDTGKTTLTHFKNDTINWKNGSKFTLIHMMMPHTPYRNKDCTETDYKGPRKSEYYETSVYCVFNRIIELSNYIIKNYPDSIIVVQADHGIFTDSRKKKFKQYPKNFIDHNKRIIKALDKNFIDWRLGSFMAVKNCKEASELDQAHIIKSVFNCINSKKITLSFDQKSYWAFYEKEPQYGLLYRVYKHESKKNKKKN